MFDGVTEKLLKSFAEGGTMKYHFLAGVTGFLLMLSMAGCGDDGGSPPPGPVGWAIGHDPNFSAVIVHTANGGLNWEIQGDTSRASLLSRKIVAW
jgi:hypothetical protein